MSPHRAKKSTKRVRPIRCRSGITLPQAPQKNNPKLRPPVVHLSKTESFLKGYGQNWKTIFNNSHDGILIADMATKRFVRCNRMIAKMLGHSEAELLSLSVKDIHPAQELKRVLAGFDRLRKGQASAVTDIPMRRKDQSSFYADITCARIEFSGRKYLVGFFRDITERKKSKEMLIESEEMFRTLTERSPNMIFINQGGKVVYANPMCEKVMGYKRQEFYSPRFNFLSLMHPDDLPTIRRNFLAHQQGAEVAPYEYKMVTKGGKLIHGILTSKLIHYRGAPAILGIITDVTERKQAEMSLRESENRYRMLVETTGTGYVILDLKGRVLDANREYLRLSGHRDLKKILGRSVIEWTADAEKENNAHAVDRCLKKGCLRDFETTYIDKRGVTTAVLINAAVIGNGGAKNILSLCQDITERKRAEEAVLKAKQFNESVIASLPGIFYVFDPKGKILRVNEKFLEVTQYSLKQILAMHPLDFFPQEEKTVVSATIREVFEKGESRIEADFLSKDGKKTPYHFTGLRTLIEGRPFLVGVGIDVAERKQAEKDLKKVLSLERATLESTADGILVVDDLTRKVTDFNSRFAQLWQVPRKVLEDHDDKKLLNYVLPQLREPQRFLSQVLELYDHPRKNSFDVLEFKDGRIFERYSHPQLLDGKPVGRVWSFRDVTGHKRAAADLRASEQRYRSIFESSHDAMMTIEPPSWRFTSANLAMVKMFQAKNVAELLSRNPWMMSPKRQPDGRLSFKKAGKMIRIALREGAHFFEWTHRRLGGSTFPAEVLLTKVAKDKKVLLQATVRDITERKAMEEIVSENRRQLRQIIDTVPHMIFAKDSQGRLLLANQAVGTMYNREPHELIGKRRQNIHPVPEEAAQYEETDRRVLTTGKPFIVANELCTDAMGVKHILQTIKIPFKMTGVKKPAVLVVSVDVTEQRKVEDFRNEIIRTVSHELRTPLSIEKEGISLLMDEMVGPVNTQQKEILETVMRNIDRLARMISSLLDVSSIETGKIKLVRKVMDLEPLVKDVIFEFKKRAVKKGIDLSMEPAGCAVQVLMDPDKIMQVLSNLVDNAIKFTPEGGAVRVSLAVSKHEVKCEIRDTGIGIAPENIAKAFEKFQQFSRKDGPGEKGFGLGLSIAKGIVELHGGRIWIEDGLGKGTRVAFSLRVYQAKKDQGHA